jgi:Ras and EF-hand domain-containing protein
LEINCEYLGDSGVGKTSFIQRFCRDNFNETFSATVGIDLQAKMLNIDNQIIALQLWDTVKINFLFVFSFILFF